MSRGRIPAERKAPVIELIRIKKQKLKIDIDTRHLVIMEQYINYLEEVTGEKATPGEVVGGALAQLPKVDAGFHKWQEAQADGKDKRVLG